jgi:cysteine-rich repeat protein
MNIETLSFKRLLLALVATMMAIGALGCEDPPICGDGIVQSENSEQCDDGNLIDTDECTAECRKARCGDGIAQAEVEECDDGNGDDDDGCRKDCLIQVCGDGIHQITEECDDGNQDQSDACRTECLLSVCGDGHLWSGVEQCDDGNESDGDACLSSCQIAVCGDGATQIGVEECDDGNLVDSDTCRINCMASRCGDGIVRQPPPEGVFIDGEAPDDQADAGVTEADASSGEADAGPGDEPTGAPEWEECDDGNDDDSDACLATCVLATCGDGIVWGGVEGCDDGNDVDDDGCTNECMIATCGDGLTQPGEECDDGNTSDEDACLTTCVAAWCGDGFVQLDVEPCDDGNDDATDACLSTCVLATCGDGFVQEGVEQCDDGNPDDADGCTNVCLTPVCGDGITQVGVEACDDGNTSDEDGCLTSCVLASCGDGIVQAGVEACDDGNDDETDDCLSTCVLATCGDGVVWEGLEVCDDGNADDTDGCLTACMLASCGDGFVQGGVEACDDGNTQDDDGCLTTCVSASCGDGHVQAGVEACDDGDDDDHDACLSTCAVASCGDGFVHAAVEGCDDGNDVDGDGCTSGCALPTCGDGFVQTGEGCDDGNTSDVDACLSTCVVASCGDGQVLAGVETCDDGNDDDHDACLSDCVPASCGDGIVHTGIEACDDGNAVDTDGCLSTCDAAICGDGVIQAGVEQCDDGNVFDDDSCLSTCLQATCGDGVVHATLEACDDGNQSEHDACLTTCLKASCGDGFAWSGVEACDDGNATETDGCLTTCEAASCGDGVVQAGVEACDDGNADDADGCLSTCVSATCGDGVVAADVEQCDDGNMSDADACLTNCVVASCGDGQVWAGVEGCDDGDADDTDACLSTCEVAICGDGVTRAGLEQCDDGNADDTDACLSTCLAASCGDGSVQAGIEACDDGNTSDSDACLSTCVEASCGDGALWSGIESCDDGNADDTDACLTSCELAVCGDGVTRAGVEACDDGNASNADACLTTCEQAACGDGFTREGVEACDDGNMSNTDGCLTTCEHAGCGDGQVWAGAEGCDDGNGDDTDACLSTCEAASCGDGFVQVGVEPCDDGNAVNGDACLTTCQVATCGDGVVRFGSEACDDGDQDETDACLSTCELASCGDGVVHAGVEGCDDGNADDTDACLSTCQVASCGDGVVAVGIEQCDDGNTSNADACLSTCVTAVCGDGHLQASVEACDDGDQDDLDACPTTCEVASCGDGFQHVGVEGCDDGNLTNTDGCTNVCTVPVCGDGVVQSDEACDDGNTNDQDYCLSTCVAASCGDGILQPGEKCDDGNTISGDWCSATCSKECQGGDAQLIIEDQCYVGFETMLGWYEAREVCDTLGASMVAMGSAEENTAVAAMIDAPAFWVGLYDATGTDTYVWSGPEGAVSMLTYTSWGVGEPMAGGDDCVRSDATGLWSTLGCGEDQAFVCEYGWEALPVNTLPVIGSVTLSPQGATTEATLSCAAFDVVDADGDQVLVNYTWFVGGAMLSGVLQSQLGDSAFVRGQSVYCRATAHDGFGESAPVDSAPIVIANTPPAAITVAIQPSSPTVADDLSCALTVPPAVDPDGDEISVNTVWKRDGEDSGLEGDTLPASATNPGEVWTCVATPSDGLEDGPSAQAEASVAQLIAEGLDCAGVLDDDLNAESGVHVIDPDGEGGAYPYSVYCDMTTDGGGWTLIESYDFSVHEAYALKPFVSDFPRSENAHNWDDYRLSLERITELLDNATEVHARCHRDFAQSADDYLFADVSLVRTVLSEDIATQTTNPYNVSGVIRGHDIQAYETWFYHVTDNYHPHVDGQRFPGAAPSEDNFGWADSDGTNDAHLCHAPSGEVVWMLRRAICGNGRVEGDEDCDDAGVAPPACAYGETSCEVCGEGCALVDGALTGYCGDGQKTAGYGEACDDGNTADGDGCSATCQVVCDHDDDGYEAVDCGGDDCDDTDAAVYPRAGDAYGDGVDSDCDGLDCQGAIIGDAYLLACPEDVSWATGKARCAGAGYTLASIRSDLEQEAFEALAMIAEPPPQWSNYWLGYTDASGAWSWEDAYAGPYEHWKAGEPDGGPGDCATFIAVQTYPEGQAGYWAENLCTSSAGFGYMCRHDAEDATPGCGNGQVDVGETCDDGNTDDGDGCFLDCTRECYSLSFDGVDDLVNAAEANIVYGSEFTVELWTKLDSDPHEWNYLFNHGWDAESTVRMAVADTGELRFNVGSGSVDAGGLPVGAWRHVALVFQSGSVTAYVDGAEVGSFQASSPGSTLVQEPVDIGSQSNWPTNYAYDGAIRQVRVSSTARYTGTFTPSSSLAADGDTMAFWALSLGEGSVAHDAGPDGFDGSIDGPAWVLNAPDCEAGSICGDGVREGDEACDDGNLDDGDGCSATCSEEPDGCGSAYQTGSASGLATIQNSAGSAFDLGTSWSITSWLYVPEVVGANPAFLQTSEQNVDCNVLDLGVRAGGQIAAHVHAGNTSLNCGGGANSYHSVETLSMGLAAWHHVAFVKDETTMRAYVDGALDNTVTNAFNIDMKAPPRDLKIGRAGGYTGTQNPVRLADLTFWSSAIGEEQVGELAACAGCPVSNDDDLFARIHFDEGGGVLAHDETGNHPVLIDEAAVQWEEGPACTEGAECGDGIQASWEACDDGNLDDGDGCSASCVECDVDDDGYDAVACGGGDCDDTDPDVHPRAGDTYGDGEDTDCDGLDCQAGQVGDAYYAVCSKTTSGQSVASSWTAAHAACQAYGYQGLAKVESEGQTDGLMTLVEQAGSWSDIWIGLSDPEDDGVFTWMDGSVAEYTDWCCNEPSPGEENCVELYAQNGWTWNDRACAESFPFVCEYRGSCGDDADCDDGDASTVDVCTETICVHTPDPDFCACDDGDQSTLDICEGETCQHPPNPDFCTSTADPCDDGNPCTTDSCSVGPQLCIHSPIDGCCSSDADCPPANDPCLLDPVCNTDTGDCWAQNVAGCCHSDDECAGGEVCDANQCVDAGGGACTNAADTEVHGSVDVADEASQAGAGCATNPDPEACIIGAVQSSAGVTSSCAGCYAIQQLCLQSNCLLQCFFGVESSGCIDCMAETCDPAFEECSGLGETTCTPDCADKTCGDDGCGGDCGECDAGSVCLDGLCACGVDCDGKTCGDDGCGGDCGVCGDDELCEANLCVAAPDGACTNAADAAVLGDVDIEALTATIAPGCLLDADPAGCVSGALEAQSGLGGPCAGCFGDREACRFDSCLLTCFGGANTPTCITCMETDCDPAFDACSGLGEGTCTANCAGKVCGGDGCGGSCGDCADDASCVSGQCVTECLADCDGKACGDDGCGGECGSCGASETCEAGACVQAGCGPDPSCECILESCVEPDQLTLTVEQVCTILTLSAQPCLASMVEAYDAAGGCGLGCQGVSLPGIDTWCDTPICALVTPFVTVECETCEVCVPDCTGKLCGDDGCGGSCGGCSGGDVCIAGSCGTPLCDDAGCDDQNLCTDDTCDPSVGCSHANNSNPCADGVGLCVDGACITDFDLPEPACSGCAGIANYGLCAVDICYPSLFVSFEEESSSGDTTSGAWSGLTRLGSNQNDLAPKLGNSYLAISSGNIFGSSHMDNRSGPPGGTVDPFGETGDMMYDAMDFVVTLTAPAQATGFQLDYVFLSLAYDEYVGTDEADKLYFVVTRQNGEARIVNTTSCRPEVTPEVVVDGVPSCYVGINSGLSEICGSETTDIAGTKYECNNGGGSTGWLRTSASLVPGERFTLRIHIHDAGAALYDSTAILDNFQWLGGYVTDSTIRYDSLCFPECNNKTCGDDGCGGSCGECAPNEACTDGLCECIPACDDKQCGDDGCGSECGDCPEFYDCNAGLCECFPACAGKECGDDGCGEVCGTCGDGDVCDEGTCVFEPPCGLDPTCACIFDGCAPGAFFVDSATLCTIIDGGCLEVLTDHYLGQACEDSCTASGVPISDMCNAPSCGGLLPLIGADCSCAGP